MASTDIIEYYKNTFPNPLAPNAIKKTEEFGSAVARAIHYSSMEGESSFYYERNALFAKNRMLANGKQPFQTYLDLMGINGEQAFVNLDYHPRPIAPKFRDILVNTIMEKIERVECAGLSLDIQKRKEDKKNNAAFRMHHKDFINQVQQQSGIQFEEDGAFTPESEEELNLWLELGDKEREELLMEQGVQFIFYNNNWNSIKKEVVGDMVDTGMGWTKNYFDGKKRIKLKRIKPEYMVHGPSNTHDFRYGPYMAHVERMNVVDLRSMWPDFPEREIFDLAYSVQGMYGNINGLADWNTDWQMSYNRPYDAFLVDVLFFEYKVIKYIEYVKGSDKNNNPILEFKATTGEKTNPNKKEYKTPIPTIYAGAWAIGADKVLEWGEMSNLLRSNEDVEDVQFSYSGYMLNNIDNMLPVSPVACMESSIVQMDLAILKIQQHLAGAAPDGVRMDIDAVTEISLGTGDMAKLGPMKLREIRLQTGDEYFSSKSIDGKQLAPPMSDAIHSMGDKIAQFITVYNFEAENLRNYIGYNAQTDGSAVPDRLGATVQQNQIAITNTATSHLYDGFISIMGNTAKKAQISLWQVIKIAPADSMYMKLLGKQNADFIKYRSDITSSNYLTQITVDMSPSDKQFLETNIMASLQQGTIEFEDAIYIRKTPNLDLAMRYLAFAKQKREKATQKLQNDSAMQQQQAEAQNQQQLQQSAAQDKQASDQLDLQKITMKNDGEYKNKLQDLINNAMELKMANPDTVIPEYVQNLINNQLMAQRQQQEAQIQAMQAQEQQQAMQQPQEQQQSPEGAENTPQGQDQMQEEAA